MVSLIVFKNDSNLEEKLLEFKNNKTEYKMIEFPIYGYSIFGVKSKTTNEFYYLVSEKEANKYCGSCALYLNRIYCENGVDKDNIRKLFVACIREYDVLKDVELKYNDFSRIYCNSYDKEN